MELALIDTKHTMIVSKAVFGCNFNEALVHQIVVAYAASARQGTRSQKMRSEVSGSGRKPWRQKGTGRARSGSVRSPIWRSGGVNFAAKPQDHRQKMNKKMYRGALKSILSELVRQNRLILVEQFSIEEPKTKFLAQKIKKMHLQEVVIITETLDRKLFLAARNIHTINILDYKHINPISLISFKHTIMTAGAVKQIEELLT